MRAVVVYESMYGNTHAIADAIGHGLAPLGEVLVVPVGQAGADLLATADLVVAGGPTHVHGLTRASTRKAAVEAALEPGRGLFVEPGAEGPGLREWLATVEGGGTMAAAFDTRATAPAALTGRASKGIGRQLRAHGFSMVAEPESFLVTKDNHLQPGEEARARAWGQRLSERMGRTGAAA
jgi:hypothetical protein